jgi:hypothetical protein
MYFSAKYLCAVVFVALSYYKYSYAKMCRKLDTEVRKVGDWP